jgi:hypothetical protein
MCAFMEPRFGHDFSDVRVHTDVRAAESAQAVNALAYTVGRQVVFGAGQYAPGKGWGRELLAHELAHVVQQASSPVSGSLEVSDASGTAELEAERAAARVLTPGTDWGHAQPRTPVQMARQLDVNAAPSTPAATPTRVDLVRISCESNTIEFETDAGVRSYTLEECDLDDGDYIATVTVTGSDVDFGLGRAAPEGVRFHFSYRVDPGQPNPSTFFGGQSTVHIVTGTLAPRPAPGPSSPSPSTVGSALVCSRPLDFPGWTGLRNFRHAFINDPPANYAIRNLIAGNGVTTSCTEKTDASWSPDDPTGGDTICLPCVPSTGQTRSDLSRCLRATYAAYPQPNLYRNLPDPSDSWHHGPNSNSFGAAMATCCASFSPAGLGWLPGWNHRPAGPCIGLMPVGGSQNPEGAPPDGGVPDAGVPDAGVPDAGVPDAGVPDAGVPDAGVPDAGVPDAGVPDAGVPDAGVPDGGVPAVACGPVAPGGSPTVGAAGNNCLPSTSTAILAWDVVSTDAANWGVCVNALTLAGQVNVQPWPSNPTSMVVPNTVNPVDGGNINNTAGSSNHWQAAIDDMADYDTAVGGGAGPNWHSTSASNAHEWEHWNADYVSDSVGSVAGGNWPQTNTDLNTLREPKATSATPAAARIALEPRVNARKATWRSSTIRRWNTLQSTTDQPGLGGRGYAAGVRVLSGLIASVRAYKDSKGW